MNYLRLLPVTLCLVIAAGCSNHQIATPQAGSETTTDKPVSIEERPSALQVLKDAGLMTNNEYKTAAYIPNSGDTMIIADVMDAPCKMIFRYVTTSNENYWIPNQIGCSP